MADNHAEACDYFFTLMGELAKKQNSGTSPEPHMHIPALLSREGIRTSTKFWSIVRDEQPKVEDLVVFFLARGFQVTSAYGVTMFYKFGESKYSPMLMVEWWNHRGYFYTSGEHGAVMEIDKVIQDTWPDQYYTVKLALTLDQNGVAQVDRRVSFDRIAKESFYPFLDKPMFQFFDEYIASKANVLLLIGPPGTGKTSFLRSLILYKKLKTLLAYNKEVIESPHLYQTVIGGGYDLLALEDADNFVMSRERENPFMSAMLNDSQGVADGSNIKLVISTNLQSINRVDSALIRPGRCFKVLDFRELTSEEIHHVWEDMGIPPHPINALRGRTLSEILNPEEITPKMQKTGFAPGFGT